MKSVSVNIAVILLLTLSSCDQKPVTLSRYLSVSKTSQVVETKSIDRAVLLFNRSEKGPQYLLYMAGPTSLNTSDALVSYYNAYYPSGVKEMEIQMPEDVRREEVDVFMERVIKPSKIRSVIYNDVRYDVR